MFSVGNIRWIINLGADSLNRSLQGCNPVLWRNPGAFLAKSFWLCRRQIKEKLLKKYTTVILCEVLTKLHLVNFWEGVGTYLRPLSRRQCSGLERVEEDKLTNSGRYEHRVYIRWTAESYVLALLLFLHQGPNPSVLPFNKFSFLAR